MISHLLRRSQARQPQVVRERTPHARQGQRLRPCCELLEERNLLTVSLFQEGVGGYSSTLDTMLWQTAPDLRLGEDENVIVGTGAPGTPSQGLLRFNNIFGNGANQIPVGAVIHSAVLNLDVIEATTGNILLHRMQRTWDENATWNSMGNGVSLDDVEAARAPDLTLNTGEGLGPRSLNVTQSLRAWSYGASYHGWVLIASSSNDWAMTSSEGFVTVERPQLVVDWSPPTPGTFDLTATQVRRNEADASVTFTIHRSRGAAGDVSVDYATRDGTAVGGADYEERKGTLQFADGQFFQTVTIPITNEMKPEEDETFFLELSNPTGGAELGAQGTATIIVVDNDGPGIFQFSATSYSVNETGGAATIRVTRTRAADGVARVNFRTDCGSAAPGEDYKAVAGTLTFEEGDLEETFTVPITSDNVRESNETIVLVLSDPEDGATLGTPNRVVLTIIDSSGPQTFQEGVAGYVSTLDTELRQATPTTRQGGNTAISVDQDDGSNPPICGPDPLTRCRTHGLMRFDNLFGPGANQIPLGSTIVSATLRFFTTNESGGTISLHRMLVPWDEDATWDSMQGGITPDDREAVRVADATLTGLTAPNQFHTTNVRTSLQAWSNGAKNLGWAMISNSTDGWDFASSENGTVGNRPQLSVVAVPPGPGMFQLSAATYSINESGGNLRARVTRTGGTLGEVSVELLMLDQTAVAGKDYDGTSMLLQFADGQDQLDVDIPVVNDATQEDDETFIVELANPTGGAIVGEICRAVATIVDNDGPGILQFSAPRYTVNENGKFATITVTRSRASDGVVTVDYFTVDQNATDGLDYKGVYNTLVFDEGVTTQTFTLYDDKELELHETLLLGLSNPKGGAVLGRQDTAILTIMDNEPRLIFRQGLNGYAGTDDTEISTRTPGTPQGNNESIAVDLEDGSYQFQGLIRFTDLFGFGKNQLPPGSIILQATLTLEVTNATAGTISMHRMLVNWSENSTWNSLVRGLQPITEHLTFADGQRAPATGTGPQVYDVTPALQAWSDGEENRGWAILNSSGDGWIFRSSEFATATQRPYLTIVFTAPGGAPGRAPSGSSGIDPSVATLLAVEVTPAPASPTDTSTTALPVAGVAGIQRVARLNPGESSYRQRWSANSLFASAARLDEYFAGPAIRADLAPAEHVGPTGARPLRSADGVDSEDLVIQEAFTELLDTFTS